MAKVQGLKICAVGRDLFYRAGLAIPKTGIDVQRASLTDDQIDALNEEPMVRVVETEIEVPDDQVVAAAEEGESSKGKKRSGKK